MHPCWILVLSAFQGLDASILVVLLHDYDVAIFAFGGGPLYWCLTLLGKDSNVSSHDVQPQKCKVSKLGTAARKCKIPAALLEKQLEQAKEAEMRITHKLLKHRVKVIRLRKEIRRTRERTDVAITKEVVDLDAAEAIEDLYRIPISKDYKVIESPFLFLNILEMPLDL